MIRALLTQINLLPGERDEKRSLPLFREKVTNSSRESTRICQGPRVRSANEKKRNHRSWKLISLSFSISWVFLFAKSRNVHYHACVLKNPRTLFFLTAQVKFSLLNALNNVPLIVNTVLNILEPRSMKKETTKNKHKTNGRSISLAADKNTREAGYQRGRSYAHTHTHTRV